MSDLRTLVIRLAHENPSLRPHLLPLLKEAAGTQVWFTRERGYELAVVAAGFGNRYHVPFVRYGDGTLLPKVPRSTPALERWLGAAWDEYAEENVLPADPEDLTAPTSRSLGSERPVMVQIPEAVMATLTAPENRLRVAAAAARR